jgi:hypothetical protein
MSRGMVFGTTGKPVQECGETLRLRARFNELKTCLSSVYGGVEDDPEAQAYISGRKDPPVNVLGQNVTQRDLKDGIAEMEDLLASHSRSSRRCSDGTVGEMLPQGA